jgi:hypothetical protein
MMLSSVDISTVHLIEYSCITGWGKYPSLCYEHSDLRRPASRIGALHLEAGYFAVQKDTDTGDWGGFCTIGYRVRQNKNRLDREQSHDD